FDTAVFSGNRSNYTITTKGTVTTVVGPDGTNALKNIEQLQFADGLFDLSGNPLSARLAGDHDNLLSGKGADAWVLPGEPDQTWDDASTAHLAKSNGPWVLPAMEGGDHFLPIDVPEFDLPDEQNPETVFLPDVEAPTLSVLFSFPAAPAT